MIIGEPRRWIRAKWRPDAVNTDAGWSWWAIVVVAAAASWAAGTLWASRSAHLPDLSVAERRELPQVDAPPGRSGGDAGIAWAISTSRPRAAAGVGVVITGGLTRCRRPA